MMRNKAAVCPGWLVVLRKPRFSLISQLLIYFERFELVLLLTREAQSSSLGLACSDLVNCCSPI